jgi:hypothetical protein
MITYEDLLTARASGEAAVIELVEKAVREHVVTEFYRTAADAVLYDRHRNPTIEKYQKFLWTVSGQKVPDFVSANWKTKNGFFPYFVTQETAHLLGNGVTFRDPKNKDRLGGTFDGDILQAAHDAVVCGEVYVFYNLDHIEHYTPLEFVPICSEVTGALMAGVRWWQVDATKPLRYTLLELDGYTEYIRRKDDETRIFAPKRAYKINFRTSEADGTEIVDGENYPGFPVVPLRANRYGQSRLVGLREKLDCYDFIESGFANDVDEASILYWTITNAGGMNTEDLIRFIERLKTAHVATLDEDVKLESHTVEPKFEARETALKRLENGLYRDAMALDVRQMQSGEVSATQIRAAYEPLTNLCDAFEAEVTRCIKGLLALAGVEDEPSYNRSKIVNQLEETQMVMMAAAHLDEELILDKLPFVTQDDKEALLERRNAGEMKRWAGGAGTNTAGKEGGSEGGFDGSGEVEV